MQHILYSFAVLGVFYGLWISYHLWWVSRPEKGAQKKPPLDTIRVKIDSEGKAESWQFGTDGEIARCDVCHWPLAPSADKGCVLGNCSYRPRSITDRHLQSGKRAK